MQQIGNDLLEAVWETQLDIDTISVKKTLTTSYSTMKIPSAYQNILVPSFKIKHS